MTGDRPDTMVNGSGMVDLREILATTGVADECFDHPRNGVAFINPALRGKTQFDWLARSSSSHAASPMSGSQQKVVVKKPKSA